MMQPLLKRRPVDLANARFTAAVPPLLQRICAARQVLDDGGLNHDLGALLRPDSLKGLDAAVALLSAHLRARHTLLVIGDFDADGATSCALAVLALRAMGAAAVDFLVPNRFEFGYGLTPEIVEVASSWQPSLIITVDNGISSIDGVARANALGIEVLVTDHHLPGAELPAAAAIVNPNQPGCDFSSKALAGVGVIFYLLSALRTQLRAEGWFKQQGLREPNMAEYLDLVALGTVADVVPLDHNNRILVEQGLRRIRAGRARPGIRALLEVAKRQSSRVVSADLGFALGPRLNAAGRLDDMSLGIQCLLTDDDALAQNIACQLDDFNRDRKAIETGMKREAMQSLQTLHLDETRELPWGLCLYDPNWHQGVIGILASRIKDSYHRPVIVFAPSDNGELKGSARSIKSLHIRDALDTVAARHPRLIRKFGGHAMAAGLSIAEENFSAFQAAFDAVVRESLGADDLQALLLSDGELSSDELTIETARLLRQAAPWGQHFPEPLFEGEFTLVQQRLVGEQHLKMVLAKADETLLIDAIAFNIERAHWPNNDVKRVRLVYKLDVNEFRGKESLQLLVEHIAAL